MAFKDRIWDDRGYRMAKDESPKDIIRMRRYKAISDEEMMQKLLNYKYTFGFVPYNTDTYIPGSWDEVEHGYFSRQLEYEEFETLAKHILNKGIEGDNGF